MQFQRDNQAAIDRVSASDYTVSDFTHNDGPFPEKRFVLFDDEDLNGMAIEPAMHHARKTIEEAIATNNPEKP